MPVVTTESGSFEIGEDECLLDALEKNGYQVEYQCRSGYCGSCRLKLIEGQVRYTQLPLAAINPDEILPCSCVVKENITLAIKRVEVANLSGELFQKNKQKNKKKT